MNSEDGVRSEEQKPKHSGYGIASFVVSIVNGLLFCCFVIYLFMSALDYHRQWSSQKESLLTFLLVAISGQSLVGFILGWVGVSLQNRRKIFGILGIVFNCLPLFVIVLFLAGYDPTP